MASTPLRSQSLRSQAAHGRPPTATPACCRQCTRCGQPATPGGRAACPQGAAHCNGCPPSAGCSLACVPGRGSLAVGSLFLQGEIIDECVPVNGTMSCLASRGGGWKECVEPAEGFYYGEQAELMVAARKTIAGEECRLPAVYE